MKVVSRFRLFYFLSKTSSIAIYFLSYIFYQKRVELVCAAINQIQDDYWQAEIPNELVLSLICGEDHRFYFHKGVDIYGVTRALRRTLLGNLEGASTIEQQLVRTLISDYRISIERKFSEICLSVAISHIFSKKQIAFAYLRVAYFGNGLIGFKNANNLIGKSVEQYGLCPSCYLIAHLKYPKPALGIDEFASRRIRRANRIHRIKEKMPKEWLSRNAVN